MYERLAKVREREVPAAALSREERLHARLLYICCLCGDDQFCKIVLSQPCCKIETESITIICLLLVAAQITHRLLHVGHCEECSKWLYVHSGRRISKGTLALGKRGVSECRVSRVPLSASLPSQKTQSQAHRKQTPESGFKHLLHVKFGGGCLADTDETEPDELPGGALSDMLRAVGSKGVGSFATKLTPTSDFPLFTLQPVPPSAWRPDHGGRPTVRCSSARSSLPVSTRVVGLTEANGKTALPFLRKGEEPLACSILF